MAIYSGFTHQNWWFSIVMLNYQRVYHGISIFRHTNIRCAFLRIRRLTQQVGVVRKLHLGWFMIVGWFPPNNYHKHKWTNGQSVDFPYNFGTSTDVSCHLSGTSAPALVEARFLSGLTLQSTKLKVWYVEAGIFSRGVLWSHFINTYWDGSSKIR